jgi:glycosyltransferase involved in cell wall biosynthesis
MVDQAKGVGNATISVVVTTYNHGEKLAAALESVRAQIYPDIELIVVDDASNDGTFEYLERFKRETPHLSVQIILSHHLGIGYSRTPGVKACKGRYLLIMDGDDWIDDADYFATAIQTLQGDENISAYVTRKLKFMQSSGEHIPDAPFSFDGRTSNASFVDTLASTFRPNWIQVVVDTYRTPEIHRIKEVALLEFPMYLMCVFADTSMHTFISNRPAVTYRIHEQSFSKNIDANFVLQMHLGTLTLAKELNAFRDNQNFLVNRSTRMFEYYISNAKRVDMGIIEQMLEALPESVVGRVQVEVDKLIGYCND